MKSNKLIIGLSITAVVLLVVLVVTMSMVWYRTSHVFIEGEAYSLKAQNLDLREKDISFAHFDTLQQQLPDCKIIWNVPFQGASLPSNSEAVGVETLNQKDISILVRYFPNLAAVNAGNCKDYDMLESLERQMPQITVSYDISLGNKTAAPDTEDLILLPEDYTYELLKENLKHFPHLKSLQLKTPELTQDQLQELRELYPELAITCTVEIMGKECDTDTKELDLSALKSEDVDATAAKLAALTSLEKIELNSGEGESSISLEDAKKIKDAVPQATLHYTFDFYGVSINTTDEEVKVHNKKIGDEGEAQVRLALDMMENCKRFVLENCRISSEVMAKIRDDYRDKTKVVWRIYFGEGTSLTDAEILRSTYNVGDDNSHDLIYLEDVKYMDIGHNEWLDDIPFVAGMKSLEVVIISGAPVHDLTPFENCPNLRILEMANCLYVPDLEPLRKCEKLEMLNISFTKVTDLSPLDDLNLTHLCGVKGKISSEEQARYAEAHPDCLMTFAGSIPYGEGWRYDENNDRLPWYQDITDVFRYPNSPNNVGWYLKEEE